MHLLSRGAGRARDGLGDDREVRDVEIAEIHRTGRTSSFRGLYGLSAVCFGLEVEGDESAVPDRAGEGERVAVLRDDLATQSELVFVFVFEVGESVVGALADVVDVLLLHERRERERDVARSCMGEMTKYRYARWKGAQT